MTDRQLLEDAAIICSFSGGLDDMRRADQSDPVKVLRVLQASGRYSAFEATANITIARMMTRLHHKDLIHNGKRYRGPLLAMDRSAPYPWSRVILTDSAMALLADERAQMRETKEG